MNMHCLTFLLVASALPANTWAAAGGLDPSFGTGGRVETKLGKNFSPTAAALQPDGKIVVVGAMDNFKVATQVLAIVRYLPTGALDTTFGKNGVAATAFTNFLNYGFSVAIQPDGKIVTVGESSSSDASVDLWTAARFNPDGSPDPAFGNGGRVRTDFLTSHNPGFHQAADVVTLQPDGKILVGGVVRPSPEGNTFTAFARYNPDGSLDPTFGTAGKVSLISIGNVQAIGLLNDGGFVALNGNAGIAQFTAQGAPALVAGDPVSAIARTGIVTFQPSGQFFFAGGVQGPSGEDDIDVRVLRFAATGAGDPTFQSPGFDFGAPGPLPNLAQSIAIAANGQLLVGGVSTVTNGGQTFGVARLNAEGSLDAAFGSGGRVVTAFHGEDAVFVILPQPDGKVIAVGQTLNRGVANIALARYLGQ